VIALGVAAGYGARSLAERAGRNLGSSPHLDWEQAHRLALRVSGWQGAGVPDRALRQRQYSEMVARSEPLVAAYLGRRLPRPIEEVHVVDRRDWLEANFASLALLLEPLEDIFQIGVLFGVLARRVLGQYDLSLLSPDPDSQGALLFVEPNIARLGAQLGLRGEDLRLWVTLHEVTHVFQFEAYPWVRPYFSDLLRQMLRALAGELSRPDAGLTQFAGRLIEGRLMGRHWLEGALSPEVKPLFERVQALMSLSEGYSNHLMRAIGRELLPSYGEIDRRMKERERSKPLLLELFDRLTGMDLKLAQYQEGEAFVSAVTAARGLAFANRAWDGPERLPTLAEIRAPERWIARLEG
jgi:coenzyme F420 biosynthesis associated uncharacterized protein